MFARTPEPPYWAVIFTSHKTGDEGYAQTSARMEELARQQPGFLGIESARGEDGIGITVSYWKDPESIRAWKASHRHWRMRSPSKRLKSLGFDVTRTRLFTIAIAAI